MADLAIIQNHLESIQPAFNDNVAKLGLTNINFNQEMAFAIQAIQENSSLASMPIESIGKAVLNCSLTGLSLNPVLKYAYLVPRKGKCCLDPSYMGLMKILTDTGSVVNIEAQLVYQNEPFEMMRGTDGYIRHGVITNPSQSKGVIIGAYSIANLHNGHKSFEWIDANELMGIMQRSASVQKGKASPWNTDPGEMSRKTVIKRHYKYLPKTDRAIMAAAAIDIDHENNGIDFKEEEQQNSNISIDILQVNPENTSTVESMLTAIMDPKVPNDLFGHQTKEQFVQDIRSEYESSQLNVEKATAIYNKVVSYFQ